MAKKKIKLGEITTLASENIISTGWRMLNGDEPEDWVELTAAWLQASGVDPEEAGYNEIRNCLRELGWLYEG
jgi:hypothetical protein